MSLRAIVLFSLLVACVAVSQQTWAQAAENPRLVQINDPFTVATSYKIYLPMLRQTLTAELHFARKVANPNEQEFAQLHRVGLDAIVDIAKQYADLQQDRQKPETWPDPHQAIAQALGESIEQNFPPAVADRYRAETSGRFDANRRADADVVVNLIDQQVLLSPEKQAQLAAALQDDWQPHWSTGNLVLMYAQYSALPETEVLRPYLSQLQQRLWAYRPRLRRATLSWQVHFGATSLFGPIGLPEFDEPKQDDLQAGEQRQGTR